MKRQDISGIRFGMLVARSLVSGATRSVWICDCDCGGRSEVRLTNLKSGNTKSCGCQRGERHGLSGSPEERAFRNAKNRCERAADPRYSQYGGRGIEFRFSSIGEFIDAIGLRPSKQHSLDRIDTDGHYEPGNVRWASRQDQALNKQNTLRFELNGETRTLAAWCEHYGQPYKRVWERMRAQGWPLEKALTTPPRPNRIAYADDSQIAACEVSKTWGEEEKMVVIVEEIT